MIIPSIPMFYEEDNSIFVFFTKNKEIFCILKESFYDLFLYRPKYT